MSARPTCILLVDDEQELVEFLKKRLERKGFAVTGVFSGKDAIREVRREVFDVAVLDLKMPEMDGIELLKEIKEVQPFLQAIMLTGHGSMDSALESGRHDAFRFLVKPYEFESLLEVIDEAIENRKDELREAFQQELSELISHSGSAHEIMHETKVLKAKYEQD